MKNLNLKIRTFKKVISVTCVTHLMDEKCKIGFYKMFPGRCIGQDSPDINHLETDFLT